MRHQYIALHLAWYSPQQAEYKILHSVWVSSRRSSISRPYTMWKKTGTLISWVLLLLTSTAFGSSNTLDVQTSSGIFRGVATGNGTEHWLGIRFAQPPVGSLRFRSPVPFVNRSTAVQDASTFGNACPQVPSDSLGAPQSEDCLFLNVSDLRTFQVHTDSLRRVRYSDPVTLAAQKRSLFSSGST